MGHQTGTIAVIRQRIAVIASLQRGNVCAYRVADFESGHAVNVAGIDIPGLGGGDWGRVRGRSMRASSMTSGA